MAVSCEASGGSRPKPTPVLLKTYGQGESKPTFAELLAGCTASAVHLEMHDQHITTDPEYQAWLAGKPYGDSEGERAWIEMISGAVARGVKIRRARIVSEPVSDYVRWEHSVVPRYNLAGGELVRWLPRQLASALALPGNPYWVLDGKLVRFSIFSGDGDVVGHQFSEHPSVARMCSEAFEAVWELATDHEDYQLPR